MRNLLIRTLSGAVFLALFLTALLWHPAAYCVLFSAAVVIMMTEYLKSRSVLMRRPQGYWPSLPASSLSCCSSCTQDTDSRANGCSYCR